MLILKMKDIDGKANIVEIRVILDMLLDRAVLVKDNMIHKSSMVGSLDHFLSHC